MTLMTGDSGSGKSSLLGHIAVDLMMQGAKVCIASMEVPAAVTLWIMSRQLIGASGPHLEKTEANERLLAKALAWLNTRCVIYDFLGITDWRMLLDVFNYSVTELGMNVAILDSVMRIGIPEDDLAAQALAAAEFANFSTKTGCHLIVVNHINKGDGTMKRRVSGSKKWTDNANNLVEIMRNEEKATKIADAYARRDARNPVTEKAAWDIDNKALTEVLEKYGNEHDAKFILAKQRHPGARQNGSVHLWFDHGSLQFRKNRVEKDNKNVTDYLLK
jgi:twinkle protein